MGKVIGDQKKGQDTRLSFVESYLGVMDYHIDQAVQEVENDCLDRKMLRSSNYLCMAIEAHYKIVEEDLVILFDAIPEYGITDKHLEDIEETITKHCEVKLLATATKANTINLPDLENQLIGTRTRTNICINAGINRIKNKRNVEKAAESRNTRLTVVGWVISILLALANMPVIVDLLKSAFAFFKAILTKQP